jgi:FixJ family two-component response regulator
MTLQNLKARLANDATKTVAADKPTVIIIDDDDGMRRSLTALLGRVYTAKAFGNEGLGLDATADPAVRAVVLDVRMPGRDGFEVYEAIRTKNDLVPIIFYSAYQDVKDPYKIMNEHRPFGYVFKGPEPDELLRIVAAAVKHCEWIMRIQRQHNEIRDMLAKLGP